MKPNKFQGELACHSLTVMVVGGRNWLSDVPHAKQRGCRLGALHALPLLLDVEAGGREDSRLSRGNYSTGN